MLLFSLPNRHLLIICGRVISAHENGAEVVEMYELFHFDKSDSMVGLLKAYLAHCFREKMDASDWSEL